MKYIKQLLWILVFCFIGEAMNALIPLPVPAAVYGLLLMFLALCTGFLKVEAVKDTADFLIGIMPILFIAPAVKILEYWGLIAPVIGPILIILVGTTVIIFAISGTVTRLLGRKEAPDGDDL